MTRASEKLERPTRTSVKDMVRGRLSVRGQDPDYVYRWVHDEDDRIALFKERGWETVEVGQHKVGERRVADASPEGTLQTVSSGNGVISYLMRIKKEWYLEDQKAKQTHIDELERSTLPQDREGVYGNIKFESKLS